jgi:Protein of unknown function (DUF3568)
MRQLRRCASREESMPRRSPLPVRGRLPLISLCAATLLLTACEPVSMTMLGVGAGASVNHHLSGIAYRTFTEPTAKVRKATLVALKKMAIKYEGTEKMENGELIKARAADRAIEIELEALTPNTTRMRTVARKDGGFLVDSATAYEIITQTEKVIGPA